MPGIAALLAAAGMTLGAGLALREPTVPANPAQATFAGGCFWCMEPPFDQLPGVVSTTSGYTGGRVVSPSYDQVSSGGTGHAEAVQVVYDPKQVSYAELLEVFWRNIDPFARNAQFCDHGPHYRSAIFVHDEEQRRLAEDSKRRVERHFGRKVETEIVSTAAFYRAEEYHQDFYRKNPLRYKQYRQGCGRDRRLAQVWGEVPAAIFEEPVAAQSMKKGWPVDFKKPADADLKKRLSPIQYKVTQHEGTEPPFRNEFWDEHRAGIYVDVVSGEPLFSSLDKFDSGTGWPSFTRPLESDNVRKRTDFKLMLPRTEVRSSHADSHLGHVFEDGPAPTGLRYCINSAALRFIPAEKLEEEGYGEFVSLFQEAAKRR